MTWQDRINRALSYDEWEAAVNAILLVREGRSLPEVPRGPVDLREAFERGDSTETAVKLILTEAYKNERYATAMDHRKPGERRQRARRA